MKNRLWIAGLSLVILALTPKPSLAFWNSPQCCHGHGYFACKALNWMSFIHYHGPLYNYGPYYGGPGYQQMYVPHGLCGSYYPAVSSAYWGSMPHGYGYPDMNSWAGVGYTVGQGYAPQAQAAPAAGGTLAFPQANFRSPTDYFSGGRQTVVPVSNAYYGNPVPGYFSPNSSFWNR